VRYQSAAALGLDLAAYRAGEPAGAEAEDLDATRRTYRRTEAGDETRRTTGDETRRTPDVQSQVPEGKVFGKPAQPAAKSAPARPRSDLFYYAMRAVAVLVLVSVAYAAWAGVSDYRLYQRGQEFEHDVRAEQITDPNQIWDQWTALSNGHASSFLLRRPRKAVQEKLVAAADHVIDTYRNDAQPVSASDWQRARSLLLRALSTDPDDKTVHGKLRVCEGHAARMSGTSRHSVADWNDAVVKFTEAQQLMPQSPDPPLGLARVYVALRDVDKAAAAFQKAESNGYQLGNRERSQLADGYRERADRTWKDAQSNRGMPQEKDQLQQTMDDYQRALELYQKSGGYGTAGARIGQVLSSLEAVSTRLQEINSPPPKPGGVGGAILGLIQALRNKSTKK
jgi:tetratricopeptide (TPR) repeat protein